MVTNYWAIIIIAQFVISGSSFMTAGYGRQKPVKTGATGFRQLHAELRH